MQLLVVRHADAGDSESFAKTGKRDAERPLSKKGRKQMRAAARGLRRLVRRVDVIATSPLVRAAQTATIIKRRYRKAKREIVTALKPAASPEALGKWLSSRDAEDRVMVVGHEPHLGKLVTWLATGTEGSAVELRKGGAALLEFEGVAEKGNGKLVWLLGPKELAELS
jgi:phosphohistidine phosphatase